MATSLKAALHIFWVQQKLFLKLRSALYFHWDWDWGVEEEEDDGDDVDPPWVLMEAIGHIEIKFEAQYV